MSEAEEARHGLETVRAVVYVHRREGNRIGALIGRPLGGRLDGVQHMKKGLKGGELGGSGRCSLVLVAVFCGCDECEGCVYSRGFEKSVAVSGPKAELVILHASLESLGLSVFDVMMVGTCCKMACRMLWVMVVGIRVSGMLVDHPPFLLARRRRPYATVLKVDRVMVKEYGQVLSWEGSTWAVLVIGSSSISG